MSVREFTPEELGAPIQDDVAAAPEPWDPNRETRGIAAIYGLTVDELLGKHRGGNLTAARRHLWTVMKAHGWSPEQIGRFTGHHRTSIVYGISNVRREKCRAAKRARYTTRSRGRP